MTQPLQLETPRLTLRRWQEGDRAAFAEMNADPIVMHYFEAPFTRRQSNESIDRYLAGFDREGFSFFAAILRDTRDFMGTIGMQTMRDVVPNLPQPAVEIAGGLRGPLRARGWRQKAHEPSSTSPSTSSVLTRSSPSPLFPTKHRAA